MAGGLAKYRHLSRKSSHRQALLRNLVTSLFTHESITTTWAKAKEAQRLAEKLITLGKKNTEASKKRAQAVFFVCSLCFRLFFTTELLLFLFYLAVT
jgi:ribosomal protein L17